MQRHLAALEALDAHARARGLALAAASAGLALAGADAASDPGAVLAGSRPVGELIELHDVVLVLSIVTPVAVTERDELFRLRLNHLHQMLHLGDHAAGLRRVRNLGDAADAVEPEPDQGLALGVMAADRAADLLDLDALLLMSGRLSSVHQSDRFTFGR